MELFRKKNKELDDYLNNTANNAANNYKDAAQRDFKQFVELSAAENVLLVFPNEPRKAYALFVINRKPLVVNGVVTIFPVTAYIQVFEFESMYPSPVQTYVPYRGVSSPS